MRSVVLVLAVAAVVLPAASAEAATVRHDPETKRTFYTAAPGETNTLTIDDLGTPGSDNVFTDTTAARIDVTAPCRRRDGDPPNVAVCPNSYSTDVLLGDGDDSANSADMEFGYPLLKGEEGDDRLIGSTGRSSTGMLGGPGRDEYVDGPRGFDYVGYSDRAGPITASLDGLANDPDGENVPPDIDSLGGTAGADVLSGSPDGDYLSGGAGNDVVRGLGGNDDVSGDDGDDRMEGGDGDDVFLYGDKGADDISGGAGFDRFEIEVSPIDFTDYVRNGPAEVSVTLDDRPGDGPVGEGDNIRSDIEDVGPGGGSTSYYFRFALSGGPSFNVLTGGRIADRLEGGPGSDRLVAREGDDTILARDGFADRIECGPGADTATVDGLDEVAGCETVDRADEETASVAGRAADDRPPTIAFTTPGADALVGEATTVRVDARDDRAVSRVLLFDDGRVVASDDAAPYDLAYAPKGDDVGRQTLVAVAVDAAEQTATAVQPVRVDRFAGGLRRSATPPRDRRAPYRFTVAGEVTLPAAVTRAQACREGEVSVQIKRGTRTISTRRARLDRRCAFRSTVAFRDRRRLGAGRLTATVRFLGNDVLRPTTARAIGLRAG